MGTIAQNRLSGSEQSQSCHISQGNTTNYQFTTRIYIKDTLLDIVQETLLLGTILTSDLSWNKNTDRLVNKGYCRMTILRKLYGLKVPIKDLITIYVAYIRSLLELSCVVWHSSLTEKDSDKLERVQKVGLRIILKDGYVSYEKALQITGLYTLKCRHEMLCLNFAWSALKSTLSQSMFPRKKSDYHAQTARNRETFLVQKARTDRLQKSAIPCMQRLLNKHDV